MQEALLDAAFAVLVREGPDFGVASVAREADASKALVFHHFGSREGLVDAMAARVISETREGLARLVEDYPDPRARIEALARALLAEPSEAPAEAARILRFWLEAGRGGARDALVAALVRDSLAQARARSDADEVATMLLVRWHGATAAYAMGRAVDFEREQDALVADLARVTGGP